MIVYYSSKCELYVFVCENVIYIIRCFSNLKRKKVLYLNNIILTAMRYLLEEVISIRLSIKVLKLWKITYLMIIF